MTDSQPKCYARVSGRRIIDWALGAFARAGITDIVFIGGYQIDMIRQDYPQLTFCHNSDWQNNNILASLMCAEQFMNDGFACAYSDILFRDSVVRSAMEHRGDIVLCVDSHWRKRYADRSQHPEHDAEKVLVAGDYVTSIHREIPSENAGGEYIGIAKFSPSGAAILREHFHCVRREFSGKPWRDAKIFEKAYLITLFAEMIERNVPIHFVATDGDYMEIDTEEDYELANRDWQ